MIKVCSVTSQSTILEQQQTRFVLHGIICAIEHLRVKLYRSELLLIASTLLVVKAENIYWNINEIHKAINTELSHYTAFRNSVPCHKAVHWLHHRCYVDEQSVHSTITGETS